MTRLRTWIDIAAPIHDVWSDLADISRHVEWMGDARSITFLTDQREGEGTSFDCLSGVGPLHLVDRMTVLEWDPPQRMRVRHEGVVTGTGTFELLELRGGGTRFTWTEELTAPRRLGGPLTSWLAVPVLRFVWRRSLRRLSARFD